MFFLSLAACGGSPSGPSHTGGSDTEASDTGDSDTGDSGATVDSGDSGETGDSGDTGAPVTWSGPEVSLQDCTGATRTFEELAAGREGLVVGIGAGWCQPCQDDAPLLQDFSLRHPELGLAVVLVEDAGGSPATRLFCEEWVAEYGLTYPVLVDPVLTTEGFIGAEGLPVHLAWRPDGTEVYRASGPFVEADVLAALGG